MKVLQLCLRVPDPPGDGGAIAMKAIAESLIDAGAEVKVLAFNTRKHFVDPSSTDETYRKSTRLETVYLDATVKIIPAFINLFTSSSYNIQRFKSRIFGEKLVDLIKNNDYDVVQIESLFLSPYVALIRQHSKARIVLREHNIEYLIWQRMEASSSGFFKKKYLGLLAERLRKYEVSMLNEYDAILPVTKEDEITLREDGCRLPVFITPIGLDTARYKASEPAAAKEFSVFHLGSMDWMPNIEAVDWFISKVLPGLKAADKNMMVYLAGKKMPSRFRFRNDKTLVVEDIISNAMKYMSDKTVMVVPLLSGSGIRVKIIEGMAMGKTIISTTVGAEGIEYTHLKNIIIADTPGDFIKWIIQCKQDPLFCQEIGRQASLLAASKYDNKIIGHNLYHFYANELLGSFNLAP